MSHSSDVIIIGAGAAGLMCAIEAAKRGRSVLVLDKAKKAAGKILISGGGRCNFTNLYIEPSAYLSNNPHFCKSPLARYTQWDFMDLLAQHGLSWEEKTQGQLFCTQKSKAIVQLLLGLCRKYQVTVQLNTDITQVSSTPSQTVQGNFLVQTASLPNTATIKQQWRCESLVIATGGPSIPKMGSSDFGLRIAKQFGIKSIPFRAGLVPFIMAEKDKQRYFAGLSGIAFRARVSCQHTHFLEHVLITHKGLSGPAILQISSYWRKGEPITVDLCPDFSADTWLIEKQHLHAELYLATALAEFLPKRWVQRWLLAQNYPNQALKHYSKTRLEKIAAALHQWRLVPTGTEGMRTAEVALGGVDTAELSSKTLVSKRVPNLYFIGETVDVTGWLGGYNFQWAWSSAWCAGQYV
ncbi:MAG: NAD(P)/FAD-dependent oxidoreductase [bacterium]